MRPCGRMRALDAAMRALYASCPPHSLVVAGGEASTSRVSGTLVGPVPKTAASHRGNPSYGVAERRDGRFEYEHIC